MNGKVYYIDFIQNDVKVGNMGVIKGDMRGISCVIHMPRQFHELKCAIYAVTGQGDRMYLTDVYVMQGRGQARYDIEAKKMQEWKSIWIQISVKNYGICNLQKWNERKEQYMEKKTIEEDLRRDKAEKMTIVKQRIEEPKTEWQKEKTETIKMVNRIDKQEPKDTFIDSLPPMKTDKWEQLLQLYPQVHIFPEAETIVIKPKDMIVLTKEHQELATNSFVLHAYYNYRQLLLIRYHNKTQKQYYLGVPGIYFEREKRVAMLFGFEGFENGEVRLAQASGKNTYTGCFGYYVKQVEI